MTTCLSLNRRWLATLSYSYSNEHGYQDDPYKIISVVDSASVDVVASRAALAYVADKKTALAECLRILKPGGRLSVLEPVLQDVRCTPGPCAAVSRINRGPRIAF